MLSAEWRRTSAKAANILENKELARDLKPKIGGYANWHAGCT